MTRNERLLVWTTFLGCVAVNFEPIHSTLSLPIIGSLAFLSFLSPLSGVLYLAASQVIPDPIGAGPLTVARLGVIGFLAVNTLRGTLPSLRSIRVLASWGGVLLLWWTSCAMAGEGVSNLYPMYSAFVVGLIGCGLAEQARGRYLLCFLMITLGALTAVCQYWGSVLGLRVVVYSLRYQIEGYTIDPSRAFAGRGDSGVAGPNIAIAMVGLLAVAACLPLAAGRARRRTQYAMILAGLLICPPALLATASRTALVMGVLCTGLVLAWLVRSLRERGRLAGVTLRRIVLITALVSIPALVLAGHQLGVGRSLEMLSERQAYYGGLSNPLGGRAEVWTYGFRAVLKYPVLGPVGRYYAKPRSYTGAGAEYWCTHNSFIDAGIAGGVPGMVGFAVFFLLPVYRLWPVRRHVVAMLALTMYTVTGLMMFSASILNHKTFWIMWPLVMAIAASTSIRRQAPGNGEDDVCD